MLRQVFTTSIRKKYREAEPTREAAARETGRRLRFMMAGKATPR
jgi:hypothetical protein